MIKFVFGRYELTLLIFLAVWILAYKLINNVMLLILFIPISMILIRTLRSWYFKEDIFAHPHPVHLLTLNINDDETMEHMCLPTYVKEIATRYWFPALITQPHSCQPEIFYSENGKWKASITHTNWHAIPGLMIKHRFTVKYESAQ